MEDSVTPDKGPSAKSRDDNVEREQVHFYPGDKLLLYMVDGKVRLRADAWGGPEVRVPDKKMDYLPTNAGVFVIHGIEAYRTDTWPNSKIKWGTPIRRSRTRANKIEYRDPSGQWRPLYVKDSEGEINANRLERLHEEMYGLAGDFPDTWFLNDFGPKAIRYYEDLNKNRRLDPNEHLEGEMIHTTPDGEAETEHHPKDARKVPLGPSHGCIHVRPIDRDDFIDAGAFRQGMTLIIHSYQEHFTAPESKNR